MGLKIEACKNKIKLRRNHPCVSSGKEGVSCRRRPGMTINQVNGNYTRKMDAFKNCKCADHNLFFGIDLYSIDTEPLPSPAPDPLYEDRPALPGGVFHDCPFIVGISFSCFFPWIPEIK